MSGFFSKAASLIFLVLLLIPVAQAQRSQPQDSDWISLFNGKDLTGWDIKIAGHALNDNYQNTFVAEDGMIRVKYDGYKTFDGKYGHIYYKQPFSYYRLRFQYRFLGDQVPGGDSWNVRNSGIMLHSEPAWNLGKDQTFPVSLEMQFLGGLGSGERATGNLCTPGTIVDINGKLANEHCINSTSKTYHGDQWVKGELIVYADSVIHQLIEGDTVLTYTNARIGGGFVSPSHDFKMGKFTKESAESWMKLDNTPLKEGYIALQSESHAIDFKDIELLPLKGCMDPKASNFKSYYQINDKGACTYK
ncbi:3-keto-disaccharide hydrolase [Arundinibacter roseus]|uniref:DUF1080 domain-containing protein n=1 Tax=Arundinibacter roseus TaxID=2070510 RepID=A0A4V2X8Q9_9BACT|nr:DUF1080 domain-containing protein [Arundinibacter roseus]TDB60815.1 DUF1080 domain-containing protein [Arundinibacter roseus]